MTEQLKPCPFCGRENVRIKDETKYDGTWVIWHYCEDDAYFVYKANTKEDAIDKWNSRAISADEKEQLRRLKSFARDFAAIGKYTGGFISTCYFEKLSKDYQICDDADWLKD
jgi:Lar family restriction alleviation protein